MSPPPGQDAQVTHPHRPPGECAEATAPADQLVQQWRDLRGMLIAQLDMFEGGGLTLRANHADVSSSAIAGLKVSILEFDALISKGAAPPA